MDADAADLQFSTTGGFGVVSTEYPELVVLPPLPGSAELFLSALVSMGAWHLARSARDIRVGLWSEWCHVGEPIQIDRSVGDEVRPTALLLLIFAPPRPPAQPVFHVQSEQPRQMMEWSRSVTGPRGPPVG